MAEEKKNEEKKIVEIDEEELDLVAGGIIPRDEWNKMTPAERVAAKRQSLADRKAGNPCRLD